MGVPPGANLFFLLGHVGESNPIESWNVLESNPGLPKEPRSLVSGIKVSIRFIGHVIDGCSLHLMSRVGVRAQELMPKYNDVVVGITGLPCVAESDLGAGIYNSHRDITSGNPPNWTKISYIFIFQYLSVHRLQDVYKIENESLQPI